ncbi:hypothetical protein CLOSTHATH_06178 [Hungatella hathewayi DSM 13479]|uniref:Uncharacterized protein n=1 Tax=Hungatella hathewayi DSM 13479 TaxID=566550 RepID=D3ARC3_9FIRM|nr:hypothetical protein CLOSTHATH_06178 [Hungatella hathewayi DSM 13479]
MYHAAAFFLLTPFAVFFHVHVITSFSSVLKGALGGRIARDRPGYRTQYKLLTQYIILSDRMKSYHGKIKEKFLAKTGIGREIPSIQ